MELNHVTSLLLVTLAMTFTLTRALPYNTWMGPDPEVAQASADQLPADYMPSLDRLRLYMALKVIRQQMDHNNNNNNNGEADQTQADDKGTSRAKRLDFGFAGLDNMDHILSTLDRKEAMRKSGSPRLLRNMQRHGYGGVSISKLTQMMNKAGRRRRR